MAACELGSDVTEQISSLASASYMSLLLGAGASVAAGLPTWDELAVRLLGHTGAIGDIATARAYLMRQDPLLAAEAARAASDDWSDVVYRALYGEDAAALYPRALHLSVANLVATRRQRVSLLTLNLDDLLEEALSDVLEDLGRDESVVSRTAAAPRAGSNAHEVQHLHGLLPRDHARDAAGLVLTLSDFNQLATTPHPWQAAALGEAMSRGPLLLVGTTFRDPDIRQWLHAITMQLKVHGGSVLAMVAREGLALARQQFVDVAESVRQQWKAVGIDAILLQDHSDAAQLLREVSSMEKDHYIIPRDRTEALFRQQVEDFSSRQAAHSEMLDRDREALPVEAGHESDLTLWLADGSSSLVRWVSHDRVYRHPNKLRLVPLGHDSPWAAARAIAESEVVVDVVRDRGEGSRRWRTVIAAPITMELSGGPHLVVGAVSAATTAVPDGEHETEWRTALADLVEIWADRLAQNTA